MTKAIVIHPGDRYGKITVMERMESIVRDGGGTITRYLCKCDCGRIKVMRTTNLRSSGVYSCGCSLRPKVQEGPVIIPRKMSCTPELERQLRADADAGLSKRCVSKRTGHSISQVATACRRFGIVMPLDLGVVVKSAAFMPAVMFEDIPAEAIEREWPQGKFYNWKRDLPRSGAHLPSGTTAAQCVEAA